MSRDSASSGYSMPIRVRCGTSVKLRKASISIRLFSMRQALRSRLMAPISIAWAWHLNVFVSRTEDL
jgi:hypothetical protein